MSVNVTLPDFTRPLLAWYDEHRRPLPWRLDPTPYRVWVSEIMLQQTRVEAVKPYFARFMKELPTVESLAACDPERLNKLWEGLGYYSRVRNLQKAAILVTTAYGGQIPRTTEELLKLPGIGSYTAGAIASFAYNTPAAAVDGNVLRVLARLNADPRNILDPVVKRDYEAAILAAIPHDRPGDYNQALIEVGATVCGPNTAPCCTACPLAKHCRAYREDLTDTLPVRAKKKARRCEEKTVLVIRDGGHTLLHRRPESGLLAGLYEFPSIDHHAGEAEVLAFVRSLGLEPLRLAPLADAKHVFTHIEWHMRGFSVTVADACLDADTPLSLIRKNPEKQGITPSTKASDTLVPMPCGDYLFADTAALTNRYAVPSAFAAYLAVLSVKKGSRRVKGETT